MNQYDQYPSPCYILSEEALLANLQLLDLVQKEAGVKIICALKGYAFWPSFPLIREWLSGATASSVNEARLIAEEMGCEAHTYAPVYTEQDFEQLLMFSSHLTFNSLTQYERFRAQAAAFPKKVSGDRDRPLQPRCTGFALGYPARRHARHAARRH